MRYQARFTQDGARRMGLSHLAGQVFEYESLSENGPVVLEMYYNGERIGSNLSYAGKEPDCELITRPA